MYGLEDLQQTLPPVRAVTPAAHEASVARESNQAAAPPNGHLSLPHAAPEAEPASLFAKPKTWLGVVITCLLGVMPIVALVLVRWQGSSPEVPAPPMEVVETGAAPTQVIERSAPASAGPTPALTEAEPEVVAAPLEPRVAPAATAQVTRTAAQPNGRVVPLTATLSSPPSSGHRSAPCAPAPVRQSWFHR